MNQQPDNLFHISTDSLQSTIILFNDTMNLPGPKGQPPPINLPARHFSSADKELLKSGKYADAEIIANGKTYNVHRGILCTRNKWFRTIFESGFRVSVPHKSNFPGPG